MFLTLLTNSLGWDFIKSINMENLDYSKVIVALDNFSVPMAEEIMDRWRSQVYGFKLNHLLYPYVGKYHNKIFCDYKLFDIPNTMCTVIEHLITSGADMVTVHMSNNKKSIETLKQYSQDIKLLGVTVLTSWDNIDVNNVYNSSLESCYNRSIDLMEDNGFYGMICSPQDLSVIKHTSLKKICPGIRLTPGIDDQVRTSSAEQAFSAGADYLVMGRSFFNNKQ